MTENPEIKRALQTALDPIETSVGMPQKLRDHAKRRRLTYGSLTVVGVLVAVGLSFSSLAPWTSSVDPATFDEVVPYERLPLPSRDGDELYGPLTEEQLDLIPYYEDLPERVAVGDDIHYVIELYNPTEDDISLDPCPSYFSSFGESATAYFDEGYLNCDAAPPVVPSKGSVRFEMILHLPHDVGRFTGGISWRLEGAEGKSVPARLDSIFDRTEITVSRGGCIEWNRGRRENVCQKKTVDSECPPGIEGEGEQMSERYPPQPVFEAFNRFRVRRDGRADPCITVLAGQQMTGEDGEYEPNGYLLILNDYENDSDGVSKVEVPLPRPIRVYQAKDYGGDSFLVLQSLADCSGIGFSLSTRTFSEDPGDASSGPCPTRRP